MLLLLLLVTRLTVHLDCSVVKDVMADESEAHALWLLLCQWRPRPIIERKVWLFLD